jgi:hypothetical protein
MKSFIFFCLVTVSIYIKKNIFVLFASQKQKYIYIGWIKILEFKKVYQIVIIIIGELTKKRSGKEILIDMMVMTGFLLNACLILFEGLVKFKLIINSENI